MTEKEYAEQINLYVPAMRAVNADIELIDEANDQLIIYLINKKQSAETLLTGIKVKGFTINSVAATSFVDNMSSGGHLTETEIKIEKNV